MVAEGLTLKTILVVEDHEAFSQIVNDLLAALYPQSRVLNARNGEEGLELALAEKPDLILLDILMPVMDGYEMTLALRERLEGKLPPIVVMTNARDVELTIMRMGSACQGVLRKPFSLDELEATLAEVDVRLARDGA